MGLYSMHTQRERMQRACSHTMACYPMGWVPAEVLQPALPPPQMGWYPVRRGWGEPTRCARPASRSIYTITAAIPTAVCYASLVATLHGYREAYRVPTPYAIALYGLHAAPLQHYSVGCITGTLLRACHVESVCVYHSMHTERERMQRERMGTA